MVKVILGSLYCYHCSSVGASQLPAQTVDYRRARLLPPGVFFPPGSECLECYSFSEMTFERVNETGQYK